MMPPQFVTENQRSRLLTGVDRAMARCGYAELMVQDVIREARVSRTTFYEIFER